MADKIIIDGQELENVSGGQAGGGYNMTVGDCGGGYLALRPEPVWDQYHELARMYPGYTVFTYGSTTRGTGLNGVPCTYTYVRWDGITTTFHNHFYCQQLSRDLPLRLLAFFADYNTSKTRSVSSCRRSMHYSRIHS